MWMSDANSTSYTIYNLALLSGNTQTLGFYVEYKLTRAKILNSTCNALLLDVYMCWLSYTLSITLFCF